MNYVLNVTLKAVILSSILFFQFMYSKINQNIPKLTVILVIDQFAHHYLDKMGDNFNYAFKRLSEKGINFTNAHHPHGTPTTATGHTALNTGAFANKHGIVLNEWEDDSGKVVKCDQDDNEKSLVFGKHGLKKFGKSAKNIQTIGLTDLFLKKSKDHKSFSLSYKSRAAIGMAGKTGNPIWFDDEDGIFTTSKAFFDEFPDWVKNFNEKTDLKGILKKKKWSLFYSLGSDLYNYSDIKFHENTHYKYARFNKSLALSDTIYTSTTKITKRKNKKSKKYDGFLKSPYANKVLLDLAKDCVINNLNNNNKLLLWISLSPLDKLGHVYGPQSLEVTDMLYHLDKQIQEFWDFLKNRYDLENILFVLTADHGIEPLIEVMQKRKVSAYRISASSLIKEMNDFVFSNYKINNFVKRFKTSQFYFDNKKFLALDENDRSSIIKSLKTIILSKKGVKSVWSNDELLNLNVDFDSPENFYKQQLYNGRSGNLICMPEQFSTFTDYLYGAEHRSAYDYNTNVPLIVYQKGRFEKRIINRKVWIPQLPVSLAKLFNLGNLSDSEFTILPF